MKQHLPRFLLASLALGITSAAFAQSSIPYVFTARPKNTFSAGLKMRSGGAKVKFGQLGTVSRIIEDPTSHAIQYDDGYVFPDAKAAAEDAATTVKYIAGGLQRYQTYVENKDDQGNVVSTTLTSDNVAFVEGQTRNWGYTNASQVAGDIVTMHGVLSATSEGGTAEGESKGSSAGFDLQLNHDFGDLSKHVTWGLAFSIGVEEINAKVTSQVTSMLTAVTDKYRVVGGTVPAAPYDAPSYQKKEDGTLVTPAFETTVPLTMTKVDHKVDSTAHAAVVEGTWKVKGAYYLARLGPSFRYQPVRRFSILVNAGPAIAYVGSEFSAEEHLVTPSIANPPGGSGVLRKQKAMFGFYAEANAEFWFTYQTGLFAGVIYEHLGKFRQNLVDRTADIDIGSGSGFRLGIVTRF